MTGGVAGNIVRAFFPQAERAATQTFSNILKAGGEKFGQAVDSAVAECPALAGMVQRMTPQHTQATGEVLGRLNPLLRMTGQVTSPSSSTMSNVASHSMETLQARTPAVSYLPNNISGPLNQMFNYLGGTEALEKFGMNFAKGFGTEAMKTTVKTSQLFMKFMMDSEKRYMQSAASKGMRYERTPYMIKQFMKEAHMEMKNSGAYREAGKELQKQVKKQAGNAAKKVVKEQVKDKADELGEELGDILHDSLQQMHQNFMGRLEREGVDPKLRKALEEAEEKSKSEAKTETPQEPHELNDVAQSLMEANRSATLESRMQQMAGMRTPPGRSRIPPDASQTTTNMFKDLESTNREFLKQQRMAQSMSMLGGNMGMYRELLASQGKNDESVPEEEESETNGTEAKEEPQNSEVHIPQGETPQTTTVEKSGEQMANVSRSNAKNTGGITGAALSGHMFPVTFATMFLHSACLGMMMNEGHYNPDEVQEKSSGPNGTPSSNPVNNTRQTQVNDLRMEEID